MDLVKETDKEDLKDFSENEVSNKNNDFGGNSIIDRVIDENTMNNKQKEKIINLSNLNSQDQDNVNNNLNNSEKVVEDKNNPKFIKKETNQGFFENYFAKAKISVEKFLRNKYNLIFLLILFLALLIRLKYIGQESLWNDAAVHLWYSIKITKEPLFFFTSEYLTGDYFTVQTLTALVYLITKNVFIAGKIIAVFFGMLGVIFIYLLASELKNKFVGVISAAILSFHHLFWFYGVRPLADAPLTTMIIITLYFLIKLEQKKTYLWSFFSIISFLALFLVKKQGVLLFLAYLIYLAIFKRKEALRVKQIFVVWFIPVILIPLASIIVKRNLLGEFFGRIGIGLEDPGLNAMKHFVWIFSWYLIIPMILGVFLIIIYKKREYYLPITFFFVYWVYFELSVGTPEDRYILPLLSVGILLATFSLTEISYFINLFFKKSQRFVGILLIVIFIIFISWNFYTLGDTIISQKSNSYAGHAEAGKWMKENIPEDAIIFAGSPRMVRTFVEREYAGPDNWDKGGTSLWYLRADRYLTNKTTFEEDLNILAKEEEVYLEIDIWEYTQPNWYFPITQDSINYFVDMGFKLVYVVERGVNTQNGLQKMPVIFLFKKEKEI